MPGESLREALKMAKSYENREAHGSTGNTKKIGTEKLGNRLYDIHIDQDGKYFYTVRIVTNKGPVSEYEAIFGRPEPIQYHKNKERKRLNGSNDTRSN